MCKIKNYLHVVFAINRVWKSKIFILIASNVNMMYVIHVLAIIMLRNE